MMAASWIGPAIVAAFISAVVTGLGWFVSERQARLRELTRRRERVADVQTALLAEIRANAHRLGNVREVTANTLRTWEADPDFTPFVPQQVPPFVLNAIVSEIHILPNAVIDPIVIYYRQLGTVALFINDLRSDRFTALTLGRKQAMYRDYTELLMYADVLGEIAADALAQSLNRKAADRSGPLSGAEPDEVWEPSPSQSPDAPGRSGRDQHNVEPRS